MSIDTKYNEFAKTRARLVGVSQRAERKAKDAKKALDELDAQIREAIINDKQETVRARGTVFTPSSRLIAEIYDRDAYFEYACRKENRDLLHARISMEAATERWNVTRTEAEEAGVRKLDVAKRVAAAIPGVRPGSVPTLSVTKGKPLKGVK